MVVSTLVISASSDIGFEFVKNRSLNGECVFGTYRDTSSQHKLNEFCQHTFRLDLSNKSSYDDFILYLKENRICWDKVLFCPCQPFPYKDFFEGSFQEWYESFLLNSINQLDLLHRIYYFRSKRSKVMFFAGGGSNSAVAKFSAYTSAKIHLIKMIELLDYENKDIIFSILGPGWVKTKNHLLALKHSDKDSEKYKTTKEFLESPKGATPIEDVIESINWIFSQEKDVVGGRNFSTAYDPWPLDDPRNQELVDQLISDMSMFKLRRSGNSLFPDKRY